jgi:membrane fusion protein, multidrug efflux system
MLPRMIPFSAVLVLASIASGCTPNAQAQGKPSEDLPLRVSTVAVADQPMPEYMILTGTLSAWQQSDVAANAVGKVIDAPIERGQRVKKGQVLARLDARSAALGAQAAQAQARLAETQASLASQDCARGKSLYDNNAISDAEYQKIMSQCSSARWSREAAEANRMVASKTLSDAIIRAPFEGVIGERFVNIGEFVQSSTRVASVYEMDPLRLEVTVPEASVALVREGLPIVLRVAAFGDEAFGGRVKFISPNIRRASRDLVVEAVVDNPGGRLRPGMFATVKLETGRRPVAVVPESSVRRDDTTARVYAVVDRRIQERIVQTGERSDGVIAIPKGISVGERVVAAPGPEVRDGVRVE